MLYNELVEEFLFISICFWNYFFLVVFSYSFFKIFSCLDIMGYFFLYRILIGLILCLFFVSCNIIFNKVYNK